MALFLLAGKGASNIAFAKQLCTDYLKMEMTTLSESNLSSLLPKFDQNTIVFIENGFTLGASHAKFVDTIKAKHVTLLFKDSSAKAMKGYVGVALTSPYTVVHNAKNGRKQQVIGIGLPIEHENRETRIESDFVAADESTIPKVSPSDLAKPPIDSDSSAGPVTPPADLQLRVLASWLKDDRFVKINMGTQERVHYWQHDTSIVLPYFDVNPSYPDSRGYPDFTEEGRLKSFYEVSISMYAVKRPAKYKFIQFTQTDACGMSVILGKDDISARGHFNDKAETYIYPGSGGDPHNSAQLPSGWMRPLSEPKSPNSETTYTSTTGWGVSVEGGADPDGPSANVTAGVNQENSQTRTIHDFSVRNRSDGRMSGWEFYYTAMDNGGYEDHNWYKAFWGYAISGLANLAKSTLFLNTEAVYQGPQDYNGSIDFTALYRRSYSMLWSHGSVFNKNITYMQNIFGIRGTVTLDLSVVTHPQ